MVIAIDGPSGVGKSTVAARVAEILGVDHLDTGAFYRAATLVALRVDADLTDEAELLAALAPVSIDFERGRTFVDGDEVTDALRTEVVTAAVSPVSAMRRLRTDLVERQRRWVARHGGSAVVEGRDIGTVVFPESPVKVFLTASSRVRAERRAGDAEAGNGDVDQVAAELERRDNYDSTRHASPLRPAPDAVIIDTTDLSVDEVAAQIIELAIQTGAGSE